MTAIGDPSRFAADFELDENFGGEWLGRKAGMFCYLREGKFSE